MVKTSKDLTKQEVCTFMTLNKETWDVMVS